MMTLTRYPVTATYISIGGESNQLPVSLCNVVFHIDTAHKAEVPGSTYLMEGLHPVCQIRDSGVPPPT